MEARMPDTLYKRLGGYDAIAAVCDDLLPRLIGDAQLARFWQNRAEDSLRREKQLPVNFLCACSGGPLYPSLSHQPLAPLFQFGAEGRVGDCDKRTDSFSERAAAQFRDAMLGDHEVGRGARRRDDPVGRLDDDARTGRFAISRNPSKAAMPRLRRPDTTGL